MVGINVNDEPAEVQKFIEEFKIPFSIVIDNTGDLVYKYRVRGHPTSIFINKQGMVSSVVAGLVEEAQLQQELARVLK